MSCNQLGCECECCTGTAPSTPEKIFNRPGLPELRYRVGTHGSFLASMLARLTTHQLAGQRDLEAALAGSPSHPLQELGTREPSDASIALLDAWASVADVLTFYQERIANEGYLQTANQRRSIAEMAHLVGYELRPGVAASTHLAYTIDENTPEVVMVPAGAAVQSIPGPGEQAQTFETTQPLKARARWNRMKARLERPQTAHAIARSERVYLAGISTQLRVNDPLLLEQKNGASVLLRIVKVDAQPAHDRTVVHVEPWAPKIGPVLEDGDASAAPHAPIAAPDSFRAVAIAPAAAAPRTLTLAERVTLLAKRPAGAPASAEDLRRTLSTSFDANGEASLGALSLAVPGAKDLINAALDGDDTGDDVKQVRVYALRVKAGLFGRTFPPQMRTVRSSIGESREHITSHVLGAYPLYDDNGPTETERLLYLDSGHDGIQRGSAILIDFSALEDVNLDQATVKPAERPYVLTTVESATRTSRAAYGGSGDATLIRLNGDWVKPLDPNEEGEGSGGMEFELIRRTVVYTQSEELALAEAPIDDPVCFHGEDADDAIELDGFYPGLDPGRLVMLSGERADIPDTHGVTATELAMIAEVTHRRRVAGTIGKPDVTSLRRDFDDLALIKAAGKLDTIHTFLRLERPLSYCYVRQSLVIYGNVVECNHGETRRETLGSGDTGKANQSFGLKQSPLTYVASATASGAESTLNVYVDDLKWAERHSLLNASATDRIFVTRTIDEQKAHVTFGDGKEGARLSTGIENVKAAYRIGLGRGGNVRAGQLSLLMTRPNGVKEVTNPMRASGGADRDGRDQARQLVPLSVTAFDRLVSVRDYQDFAATFAGIGKALAVELSDASSSVVHVTIAAQDDAPLDPQSQTFRALSKALVELGDPLQPVRLAVRELVLLVVSALVRIDADRQWPVVSAQIRRRLFDYFGFERRAFGQDATKSELTAVIQNVPGVSYVDIEAFDGVSTLVASATGVLGPITPDAIAERIADIVSQSPRERVVARATRNTDGVLRAAELLLLSPDLPDALVLNPI